MMLGEDSLPISTEADLSFASKHGYTALSYDTHPTDRHDSSAPVTTRKSSCGICSTIFLSNSSQQSTMATVSENCTSTCVCQRRKQQRVSAAVCEALVSAIEKPSASLSVIRFENPSVATKEHVEIESQPIGASVFHPVDCTGRDLVSKSASISGCSLGEEVGSVEDPKHDILRIADGCCVNDSCSSSKSNMVLCTEAMKTEVGDTGECSSSETFVLDGLHDDLLQKDARISILRCLGLYKKVWPIKRSASHDNQGGLTSGSCCLQACKVCDQLEITVKMLICDQCEEAFHANCCYPRVRKIPVDEWLCHFCLKKKHKAIKMSRFRNSAPKGALGPMAIMLEDTEPYTTNVRIGLEFQADIPVWSDSVANDEYDNFGEPMEMMSSKSVSFQEGNPRKTSRAGSISNWLQCLQVIEGVGSGVDRTVCGKWRRAPLFEVQTADWECFCSVLWDPAHADCAVPQEVDTDQVRRDLKYIETLRPRLAAKKRKSDCSRSVDHEGTVGNVANKNAR